MSIIALSNQDEVIRKSPVRSAAQDGLPLLEEGSKKMAFVQNLLENGDNAILSVIRGNDAEIDVRDFFRNLVRMEYDYVLDEACIYKIVKFLINNRERFSSINVRQIQARYLLNFNVGKLKGSPIERSAIVEIVLAVLFDREPVLDELMPDFPNLKDFPRIFEQLELLIKQIGVKEGVYEHVPALRSYADRRLGARFGTGFTADRRFFADLVSHFDDTKGENQIWEFLQEFNDTWGWRFGKPAIKKDLDEECKKRVTPNLERLVFQVMKAIYRWYVLGWSLYKSGVSEREVLGVEVLKIVDKLCGDLRTHLRTVENNLELSDLQLGEINLGYSLCIAMTSLNAPEITNSVAEIRSALMHTTNAFDELERDGL